MDVSVLTSHVRQNCWHHIVGKFVHACFIQWSISPKKFFAPLFMIFILLYCHIPKHLCVAVPGRNGTLFCCCILTALPRWSAVAQYSIKAHVPKHLCPLQCTIIFCQSNNHVYHACPYIYWLCCQCEVCSFHSIYNVRWHYCHFFTLFLLRFGHFLCGSQRRRKGNLVVLVRDTTLKAHSKIFKTTPTNLWKTRLSRVVLSSPKKSKAQRETMIRMILRL